MNQDPWYEMSLLLSELVEQKRLDPEVARQIVDEVWHCRAIEATKEPGY